MPLSYVLIEKPPASRHATMKTLTVLYTLTTAGLSAQWLSPTPYLGTVVSLLGAALIYVAARRQAQQASHHAQRLYNAITNPTAPTTVHVQPTTLGTADRPYQGVAIIRIDDPRRQEGYTK